MVRTSGDRLSEVIDEFLSSLRKGCEAEVLDAFVDLDLTMTQFRVVFTLALQNDPVPINEVAEHLQISVATAGRAVDRLMNLGMVDRREDPDDRRSKLVSLTDKGQRLADIQRQAMRERIRSFSRELPDGVADTLHAAMQAALNAMPAHVRAGAACHSNQVRTIS